MTNVEIRNVYFLTDQDSVTKFCDKLRAALLDAIRRKDFVDAECLIFTNSVEPTMPREIPTELSYLGCRFTIEARVMKDKRPKKGRRRA